MSRKGLGMTTVVDAAGRVLGIFTDKQPPRRTAIKTGAPSIERASPKTAPPKTPRQPAQLDGGTQAKLQKGKIPIEAKLDLHGYTQIEAQDALEAFVLRAAKAGKR